MNGNGGNEIKIRFRSKRIAECEVQDRSVCHENRFGGQETEEAGEQFEETKIRVSEALRDNMVSKNEGVYVKIWQEIINGYEEGGGEREHGAVHADSDQGIDYVVELSGISGGVGVLLLF